MGLMRFRLLDSFKSSLRADKCPSIMSLVVFWLVVPSFGGVTDPLGRMSAALQRILDDQQDCREDNTR
ncbi:hypothetical protein Tco_1115511 [Tanacetum coccineum]